MIVWLVGWVGVVGQLCFAIFSLAAGLYYLAELIEEYSILAKKIISYLIVFVLLVYVCLLVDGVPLSLVAVGLLIHVCYASLLTTFPVISLFSVGFLGGTVLLVVGHFLAFQFFAEEWHSFQEVVGFFFVCLWMVPFSIFISLSANDMVLPTLEGDSTGGVAGRKPRRSGFLALFDALSSKISTSAPPSRSSKSF